VIEVASRFIVGQENDTELEGRRVEYGFYTGVRLNEKSCCRRCDFFLALASFRLSNEDGK